MKRKSQTVKYKSRVTEYKSQIAEYENFSLNHSHKNNLK